MKKLVLLLFIAALSIQLNAQDSGFGLGIIVGEPTGISAKLWTTENTALDAALAWSFAGDGFLRLHSDLLWHKHYFEVEKGQVLGVIGRNGAGKSTLLKLLSRMCGKSLAIGEFIPR